GPFLRFARQPAVGCGHVCQYRGWRAALILNRRADARSFWPRTAAIFITAAERFDRADIIHGDIADVQAFVDCVGNGFHNWSSVRLSDTTERSRPRSHHPVLLIFLRRGLRCVATAFDTPAYQKLDADHLPTAPRLCNMRASGAAVVDLAMFGF